MECPATTRLRLLYPLFPSHSSSPANELAHACHYPSHHATTNTYISKDQEYVIVKVQHFGIGISETHQPKIFDRFYQVTEAEKNYSGHGIGLYSRTDIL